MVKKLISLVLSLILAVSIVTSVPVSVSAATQVDQIIAYAEYVAANNPHGYDGYCLKFCGACYESAGYPHYAIPDAYSAGTAWIQSTSSTNIPVGALVFYDYTWNANYGHVGIYAGNGKMYDAESAYGGVKLRTFKTNGYRGWGWYGGVAPSGSSGGSSQDCGCSTSYAGNYVTSSSGISLNIRAGHGTSYSVIGSIPDGSSVYISKANGTSSNSWGHITYNGVSGYVCMGYLVKKPTTATYTISYNANGGSGAPASQTKQSGTALTISSTVPTRFGYNFLGWSTSSTATSASYRPGSSFTTNANTTLYAVWSSAVELSSTLASASRKQTYSFADKCFYYTITPANTRKYRFESTGSVDTQIYIYNSSGTVLTNDDDSGSGNNFRLDYILRSNTKYFIKVKTYNGALGEVNMTIKALWSVQYNANGGSGAPATQTKVHNQDITLSIDEPTRSGYRFLGWSTSSTATTPEYASGATYSENGNETLYAVWASSHTHSYVGTVTKAATCTTSGVKTYKCSCGASYTQTIAATGHKASGWITETTASVYTAGLRYKECTVCKAVLQTEKTPQIVPAKVKLVEVANITQGIKVTWNDVAGADSYKVFRKVSGESWKCIATTRVSEFTDKTAEPGIAYYYTVRGINEGGNGSYDAAGLYITRIGTPKLTKIANGKNYVQIKWGAVEKAESYIVYRRTYNAKTKAWSGWATLQTDVAGTSYVDKTAKTGTYYIYTVKATNETGYSAHTSGIKTYYLATPQITSIANAANGVTVQWGKIAGAKGYYVYRKTTGGWTKLGSTTGTAFKDKTAKSGETYKYTVRAYYGSYLSLYNSNGVAIKRLTAPVLKSATSAKSGVTVKWGKVAGATGYIVYRKTGNGGWQKMATVNGNTALSYLDTTAKKGTTYTYTVKAYSGSYKSAHNTTGLTIKDKY